MKITVILFSLAFGLLMAVDTNGQTPIVFEKGKAEKSLTVTIGPHDMKTFSLYVKKGQVINVGVTGDINISKTEEFPVIGLSLANGVEAVDKTQDGEGYLSILSGRKGKYVITVNNSDRKSSRTFKLKVKVTNDLADFAGGEDVDQ